MMFTLQGKTEEVIVCAAVKLKDGTVFLGVRHFDGIMRKSMGKLGVERVKGHKQGFMTNKHHFVDREEAFKIAKKSNQIADYARNSGTLFSEHLY